MKGLWRAAYLDGFLIESKALILVGEELLDLKTLIALELDHLAHTLGFGVANDGAIASELLLDDLENLLMVKLARDALDSGQGLASITLWDGMLATGRADCDKGRQGRIRTLNAYVDILLGLLGLSGVVVGFGEGVWISSKESAGSF